MNWTITLDCHRREAEALPDPDLLFADLDEPPTLNVEEPDEDRPDDWRLTAYFNAEPTPDVIDRLKAAFPSARNLAVAPLPDLDWTVLSQRDLPPVRAGRLLVHTAADAGQRRANDWALSIEAGLAFGTGQHATTSGCLNALLRLARQQPRRNIADIGAGTAVLAMAAARAWPAAAVLASDIDPVAVLVARDNARRNGLQLGQGRGRLAMPVAAGVAHNAIRQAAPYDLVFANILAPPLVAMARDLSRLVAPGGVLVLAGLLQAQARRVANAYRRHGLVPKEPLPRGREWPCLVLHRPD
jgi:ribosomal protein L11 methyltransferase